MSSLPTWAARVAAPVMAVMVIGVGAAAATTVGTGSDTPGAAEATTAAETAPPTTDAPTTEAPITELPTTEAPTTEAPETEAPSTEAPTTESPTQVACDEARNHGEYVSSVARSAPKGPGHGKVVSEAAKSDCGKNKQGAETPDTSDEGDAAAHEKHSKQPKAKHGPKSGTQD